MAEAKQNAVQTALQNHILDVEKLYMRKIQKVVFECSAKCCDNTDASPQEVQYCLEKCNKNLIDTHNYLSSQIDNYQNRLQRCVIDCNDKAKDLLDASPDDRNQVERATKTFEVCACDCIDKHIDLLPKFMSKVHEVMKKKVADLTKEQNFAQI